jgi:hypothetical protein
MGVCDRQWAQSVEYKPPILFEEMQRKGREREDGTVIVGMFPEICVCMCVCVCIILKKEAWMGERDRIG